MYPIFPEQKMMDTEHLSRIVDERETLSPPDTHIAETEKPPVPECDGVPCVRFAAEVPRDGRQDMTKFTLNLTQQQEETLDSLKQTLGVSTRADVFRKAIALALLYKEVTEKNQFLFIGEQNGTTVERIRVL